MRKYFLIVPIILAVYALVIDAYYIHTYYQVITYQLTGAGAAQWQLAFSYAHWPVISALIALVLAYFITKQYLKYYLWAFTVLAVIPVVLSILMYFKVY